MMTKRFLKWGLLSTARINQAVIKPIHESPRNELLAVASRSLERAQEYAANWDIPQAFGSYEELLASDHIDVIYNPLPNSMHAEWTIKAIQAGKHVLCEKPLAISVADVERVAAAAQEAGVVVAEAFMYRHHPQTLKIKKLVTQGAIGELRMIRGSFSYYLNRPADIRLRDELGGGSLWDVGCYPINYARFIVGSEPQEVFGWQVTGGQNVDVVFMGQMRFKDGIMAQIDSSFRAPLRARIEIIGSEGVIDVPNPYKPELDERFYIRRDDGVETIQIPGAQLYLGEIEDLADAVLLGKATRVSLQDSWHNVAVIRALLRSSSENRPVPTAQTRN